LLDRAILDGSGHDDDRVATSGTRSALNVGRGGPNPKSGQRARMKLATTWLSILTVIPPPVGA